MLSSTVRRYFLPPKNNIQSSKFYKSRILARIQQKCNSQSTKEHSDFHFIRAQITTENNMLLQKSVITIISDNGSDWGTDCMANIYNLGRFREEQKLDAFIWINYAQGHSCSNPIERMFSRLTDLLQGVIIDLDSSFKETSQQLNITLIDLCKY
ncbi:unnamed protein product [Rotaria sordida]|uniref:Uncharacterized protein n=1 Tax=Rotaria sordida TaxID=392033 RepID=A0A814L799_9BILA|nr:unnamed protein product [Rotaria sordida]CAF1099733.1 unnamed protein product [Rotaria sordida]CAF3587675.1 unnamed protein product [Rotaria sordida]CAF3718472.1 unnamed protein product [Rotaria sordida]